MKLTQNHIEHLQDLLERGEITADQANVEKVKMARVQVVTGRLPAQVRKALNNAVKCGELCHSKKNGKKPEVYYHPNFEYLAKQAQREHEQATLKALAGVMARPFEV
jgi:saccharopine dehydrogenase-like NADP-dependent oxidoreductase